MHPHLHTKDNAGTCTVIDSIEYIAVINIVPLTQYVPGCEEVMALLDECHAQGFMHKVFGGCNDAKTAVNKCLRAERLERTARNREIAKEKRKKIEQIWKEIDEES